MNNILKICAGCILGFIIGSFAMSLWRNEGMDWEHMIFSIIGVLIGVPIGAGLWKNIKKTKD